MGQQGFEIQQRFVQLRYEACVLTVVADDACGAGDIKLVFLRTPGFQHGAREGGAAMTVLRWVMKGTDLPGILNLCAGFPGSQRIQMQAPGTGSRIRKSGSKGTRGRQMHLVFR